MLQLELLGARVNKALAVMEFLDKRHISFDDENMSITKRGVVEFKIGYKNLICKIDSHIHLENELVSTVDIGCSDFDEMWSFTLATIREYEYLGVQ